MKTKKIMSVNNFLQWCFILSLTIMYLIFTTVHHNEIKQINLRLETVPKKECHMEEKLEKKILEPYEFGVSQYRMDYDHREGHKLIACEDSDLMQYMPGRVVNFNTTHSKWCVIYIKKEICTIS